MDIANIRRTLQRDDLGIDLRLPAEVNLDAMFNPTKATDSEYLDAVFHYAPKTTTNDRFELCLATPYMRELAWKYGHHNLILLDGTFGISKQKVLLFVVLALDSNRKGVPIAMIHFSAPTGNRQTAAGYDTRILTRLLKEWKDALELMRPTGTIFAPVVRISKFANI